MKREQRMATSREKTSARDIEELDELLQRADGGVIHTVGALEGDIVILDAAQRSYVEEAINETCRIRKWELLALNIRTNHVHTVVSNGTRRPEVALNAFKANATRKMRETGCWKRETSPWADKGSKRYLWNERSVARAVDYVLYGQGDELPEFDD